MSILEAPTEVAVIHEPHVVPVPHVEVPMSTKERILREAVEKMNAYVKNPKAVCIYKHDFKYAPTRDTYVYVNGWETFDLRDGKIVKVIEANPDVGIPEECLITVSAFWVFHPRHNDLVIDAEKVYAMPEEMTCGNCGRVFKPDSDLVQCETCWTNHCTKCGKHWGGIHGEFCPDCDRK